MRIAIIAPARRIDTDTAAKLAACVAASPYAGAVELVIDRRCFDSHGHFAGPDASRTAAFLEAANDPDIDAIWFARGGYGSARLLSALQDGLGPAARNKTYLGYSDGGFLLAALTRMGIGRCVHGPMVADINRAGGEAAVLRVLGYLTGQDMSGLEPGLAAHPGPTLAFNLTVLRSLLATDFLPLSDGATLLLEDVGEYDYAVDRSMWQLTRSDWFARLAGVRLGRFSAPVENDVAFEYGQCEAARHWIGTTAVPILSDADIGHDADNRIVPFTV